MSTDGSGFDSTQYAELIECADNYLIKEVFDDVVHEMRRAGLNISTVLARNLKRNLTSLKTPYMIRVGKRVVEKGIIHGTVFSGHATRTTLGNSIR